MSSPRHEQGGPSGGDFGIGEPITAQMVYSAAVLRFVENYSSNGKIKLLVPQNDLWLGVEKEDNLVIPFPQPLEPDFSVRIGHYDSAKAGFRVYPELVRPSELEGIEEELEALVEERVLSDNPLRQKEFEHVGPLRHAHREMLMRNGLIDGILGRANRVIAQSSEPEKTLHADESTTVFIGHEGKKVYLYLIGAFNLNGDRITRVSEDVGLLLTDSEKKLPEVFDLDPNLLDPDEMPIILQLLSQVLNMEEREPEFDGEMLRMKMNPIEEA